MIFILPYTSYLDTRLGGLNQVFSGTDIIFIELFILPNLILKA